MGNNNILFRCGEPIIVLGPEHPATIAKDGFSKNDVKTFIHENARIPRRRFHERAIQRYYPDLDENALIPVTPEKEDIIVIVVGGARQALLCLAYFWPIALNNNSYNLNNSC